MSTFTVSPLSVPLCINNVLSYIFFCAAYVVKLYPSVKRHTYSCWKSQLYCFLVLFPFWFALNLLLCNFRFVFIWHISNKQNGDHDFQWYRRTTYQIRIDRAAVLMSVVNCGQCGMVSCFSGWSLTSQTSKHSVYSSKHNMCSGLCFQIIALLTDRVRIFSNVTLWNCSKGSN